MSRSVEVCPTLSRSVSNTPGVGRYDHGPDAPRTAPAARVFSTRVGPCPDCVVLAPRLYRECPTPCHVCPTLCRVSHSVVSVQHHIMCVQHSGAGRDDHEAAAHRSAPAARVFSKRAGPCPACVALARSVSLTLSLVSILCVNTISCVSNTLWCPSARRDDHEAAARRSSCPCVLEACWTPP